ncbi:hypothetical protein [Haloferax denitrificans]|uniref:hypothetical protein n=1 Tax=Haloferax denitrificans TaxID=35745 RepID=UPI0012683583|nr:hypothetical protein [Haloferax denitrificans]
MAVARTLRSLELYDVLANLIPGSILLLSVGVVIEIERYFELSNIAVAAAIFAVLAFTFGHVIQAFASWLNGTPRLFGDVIDSVRFGGPEEISIRVSHVERMAWPLLQRRFCLPSDFEDNGTLFRLLLSYIETTPATRSLRFQAIHSFHRSMSAAWVLVIAMVPASLLLDSCGLVEARSIPILSALVLGSAVFALVFNNRKKKFNKLFIQYALADLYMDQTGEARGLKGGEGS